MIRRTAILGGLLISLAASVALAEGGLGDVRPHSRDDFARAALAEVRPLARPASMVRYPVVVNATRPSVRPVARPPYLPVARWDHRPDAALWTRAAMSALAAQGAPLTTVLPRDIDQWCPAYATNTPERRRAFWVGMMSALAHYESTSNPEAVGGNGRWFGLLQIYPDTARRYGCRARAGVDLTDPEDNLSCAARIMAVTVVRDRAVARRGGRPAGVGADWGPMHDDAKVAAMSSWTRSQDYCQPTAAPLRPHARPTGEGWVRSVQLKRERAANW